MKSTEMCDQGRPGMDRGLSLPTGNVRETLDWVHVEQDNTTLCTSQSMLGHQYFLCMRWQVCCVPRWSLATAMWAHEIQPVLSGTNCVQGGQAAGICDLGIHAKVLSNCYSMELRIHVGSIMNSLRFSVVSGWCKQESESALIFLDLGL